MTQHEYFELQVACRERLRPLREAAGLSLSDMAARTGMDRAAIQKLESDVHANPTISTINRYLHAIGKRLVVSIVDEGTDARHNGCCWQASSTLAVESLRKTGHGGT